MGLPSTTEHPITLVTITVTITKEQQLYLKTPFTHTPIAFISTHSPVSLCVPQGRADVSVQLGRAPCLASTSVGAWLAIYKLFTPVLLFSALPALPLSQCLSPVLPLPPPTPTLHLLPSKPPSSWMPASSTPRRQTNLSVETMMRAHSKQHFSVPFISSCSDPPLTTRAPCMAVSHFHFLLYLFSIGGGEHM